MRLVVAVGGNALLRRGQTPDAAVQQANVSTAAAAVAALAPGNDLVVVHGNGPQVGLLAQESESDPALTAPYPFDVLVAETQGMIGYWIAAELDNGLGDRAAVALMTRTVVDAGDPAFGRPVKFVGTGYDRATAGRLAAERGWAVERDGDRWRRVVPSPDPRDVVELRQIQALLADGVVVVAGGGGGIPVTRDGDGRRRGVEAVVDKDLTAALLAVRLGADALLLLTDVPAVVRGFGTPDAEPLPAATVGELLALGLPEGSMGPKVEACRRFLAAGGRHAAIGALDQAGAVLAGAAGTTVSLG
ncbi:carbamate kinase [Amycolatopsis suaedae]|uniref:Carbamate kinase n=1 Tax=Amycolatopsis suaedae TaxID=2510978 RepID=A0A4Q7JF04_9PSEU|nr:carbamate kinase [Amycolatopsis suaedae]RZQ65908.1 carbamate kinase [Amycolatopsis suaedae]